MTPTATAALTATVCATCGSPATRSTRDPDLWVHEPTSERRWALPTHRVVVAR